MQQPRMPYRPRPGMPQQPMRMPVPGLRPGYAPRPVAGYPGYGPPRPAMAGYPPQAHAAPPVDPLYGYFAAVAGADGHIDSKELRDCLTQSGMAAYPRPGDSFSL